MGRLICISKMSTKINKTGKVKNGKYYTFHGVPLKECVGGRYQFAG